MVLTQADLCPKFPDQTGQLDFLCKLSTLPILLPAQPPLGHTVSGVLANTSCQMGPEDKAGGAVSQLLCLGSKGRGLLQSTLNFPNRVSGWEGLGNTLSHGYKLILLPIHSRGTLHAQYWFCSEGNQFCLPACLSARALLSCTASRYFHYPPDHIWLGVTLHSRCGCDSALCLRVGKPGSRVGKNPYLRI